MLRNLFGSKKPKEKFSLENLKYLYSLLMKDPVITPSNKGRVVEGVRSIAELMIWGDQHDASFFEFFCEKNMLASFVRILAQRCSNKVKVQVIQSLSILVQNLANEVSIFYLLSNNYINDMIVHRFDFSDEEIVAYYINFLKSLSFKLNSRTILFLFNERAQDFPLLNECIKFFNHPESMVRIAVRTTTLNVFRINDPSLRRYLLTKVAVPYFSHLVWFLRDQTIEFDKTMHAATATAPRLEMAMEHLIDQLYYIQDIIECEAEENLENPLSRQDGRPEEESGLKGRDDKPRGLFYQQLLSEILIDQLLGYYVLPLLLGSLVPAQSKVPAHMLISTRLSFFMLQHVLSIFSHYAFVNSIIAILVQAKLPPIALRMIQEPPLGPVRNSNGQPLTSLLYPKSAAVRQANVQSELRMLQQAAAPPTRAKRGSRILDMVKDEINTATKAINAEKEAADKKETSKTETEQTQAATSPEPTAAEVKSPQSDMELQELEVNAPASSEATSTETAATKPEEKEQPEAAPSSSSDGQAKPADAADSNPSSPADVSSTEQPTSSSRRNSVSTTPPSEPSTSTTSTADAADATSAAPSASASTPVLPAPIDVQATTPATDSATTDSTAAPSDSTSTALNPVSPPPAGGWGCPKCTFVNPPTYLTCSICECVRPESPQGEETGTTDGEKKEAPATPVASASNGAAAVTSTPSSSIANPSLASAYLSPLPPASSPSLPSTPTPSSIGGAPSKSPARDIPVDMNSLARSKLPEVPPLFSPIDYFGFTTQKKEITAVDGSLSVTITAPSESAAAAATTTSSDSTSLPPPAVDPFFPTPSLDVDSSDLSADSESNEYASALLRFLSAVQPECTQSTPAGSEVLDDPSDLPPPLNSPERHAQGLDERDLYGSMSVMYGMLKHERVDAELLLKANLCGQTHRKSRELFAALVGSKDLLGLTSPLSDGLSRSQRTSRRNSQRMDRADMSSIWDSPVPSPTAAEEADAEAAEKDSSQAEPDALHVDVQLTEVEAKPQPEEANPVANGAAAGSVPDTAAADESAKKDTPTDAPLAESVANGITPSDEKAELAPEVSAAPTSDSIMLPPPEETRSRAISSDPLLKKSPSKRIISSPSSSSSSSSSRAPSQTNSARSTLTKPLFSDVADASRSSSDSSSTSSSTPVYNEELVSQLLNLARHNPTYRMVTLQTMLELVKEMVVTATDSSVSGESSENAASSSSKHSYLLPAHVEQLEGIYQSVLDQLRIALHEPPLSAWSCYLLDLFEEEFPHFTSASPSFDASSSSMMMKRILNNVLHLLPIESGYSKEIPLDYRIHTPMRETRKSRREEGEEGEQGQAPSSLPASPSTITPLPSPTCAPLIVHPVERLRKLIQLLLLLRNFLLKNGHQKDTLFYPSTAIAPLPPSVPGAPVNTTTSMQPVQSQLFHISPLRVRQEVLTAHHPDAMLCTLQAEGATSKNGKKIHLFFVVDEWDLLLVELQQAKPGTAIIQIRQSLRHQEAYLNRNHACLLHVTIRSTTKPHASARRLHFNSDPFFKPLWLLTLLFLDPAQCARAYKHLLHRRVGLRKDMSAKLLNELSMTMDEEALTALAEAEVIKLTYPGVEVDVHQDSTFFGISPVIPLSPTPSPLSVATGSSSVGPSPAPSPKAGPADTPTNASVQIGEATDANAPSLPSSPTSASSRTSSGSAVPLPVAMPVNEKAATDGSTSSKSAKSAPATSTSTEVPVEAEKEEKEAETKEKEAVPEAKEASIAVPEVVADPVPTEVETVAEPIPTEAVTDPVPVPTESEQSTETVSAPVQAEQSTEAAPSSTEVEPSADAAPAEAQPEETAVEQPAESAAESQPEEEAPEAEVEEAAADHQSEEPAAAAQAEDIAVEKVEEQAAEIQPAEEAAEVPVEEEVAADDKPEESAAENKPEESAADDKPEEVAVGDKPESAAESQPEEQAAEVQVEDVAADKPEEEAPATAEASESQ